jgi:hypothetical protein
MTPKCAKKPACFKPAVGIIPQGNVDELVCDEHHGEALDNGLFCYLIGEEICPACGGRAFHGHVKCATCGNTGAVERSSLALSSDDQHWRDCRHCSGTGRRRRLQGTPPGAQRGTYRKKIAA